MGLTELRNSIAAIDRQIDAVQAELLSREAIDQLCYISWGNAWAKHPELREQERQLFIQRAGLVEQRGEVEYRMAARTFRVIKPKKCPTCKGTGRAV